MRRSSIVARVAVLLVVLGSGCAQDAGSSPPGHKEPNAPVEDTQERTATSDHRTPSGSEDLECL